MLCNRFRYLQSVIQLYWKRFSNEYLIQLHEHHIYTRGKKHDEVSQLLLNVVLIRDDSLKRNMWRKGKVKKLVKGEDGKIRGALLKVCHGGRTTFIHGPLQRIVPLEVQKDIDDIDATFSETEDNAAIEIEMKMLLLRL